MKTGLINNVRKVNNCKNGVSLLVPKELYTPSNILYNIHHFAVIWAMNGVA
jgi:hypothetical protein